MQETSRVKRDEKAESTPDKKEVICPLVLKVTNGRLAVNYDMTWLTTTKIGDTVGCWRSSPQQRSHTDDFNKELQAMKERGEIPESQNAYYFTHQQGVAAREKYQQLVLEGKVKANKKSWDNRFAEFTGTSFEELEKKFPELYAKGTSTKKQKVIEEEKPTEASVSLDDIEPSSEPTEEDLEEIEDMSEEEDAAVAASTVEAPIKDVEELRRELNEASEKSVIPLDGDEYEPLNVRNNDCIAWNVGRDDEMIAYLVELPDLETEMWLTEGVHIIEGHTFEVRIEGEKPEVSSTD